MKLAGLMALSGIDRERFNSLRRRDQLPFRRLGDRFQVFTVEDAVRMRLMVLLGASDSWAGLGGGDACSLVDNAISKAQEYLGPNPRDMITSPSTWLGGAEFEGVTQDGTAERWTALYFGTLSGFDTWIARETSDSRFDYEKQRALRLIGLVNATAAAEFVCERADELGIPVEGDSL